MGYYTVSKQLPSEETKKGADEHNSSLCCGFSSSFVFCKTYAQISLSLRGFPHDSR